MATITWRYEGGDLVVPRQLLRALSLRPGDTVSINAPRRRPAPVVRPVYAGREIQAGMESAWAEATEAECEQEIEWVLWAIDRKKG